MKIFNQVGYLFVCHWIQVVFNKVPKKREERANLSFLSTQGTREALDEVEPEVTKEPLFKLLKRQEGIKVKLVDLSYRKLDLRGV